MTDNTNKNKNLEKIMIDLPNSLEDVQKLLIDERLKAAKSENTADIKNPKANIEKKNNLTSREAEKTSQDLAWLKADTHLSEAEKTVNTKNPTETPVEEKDEKDKPKEEKGILDQAKDFWNYVKDVAVDNRGKILLGAWWLWWISKLVKRIKWDDKKEWSSEKSEDKPWYKNTWLWTGAVAIWWRFARDKWGRDRMEQVKNTFILKQKIELLTIWDTEKFLLKILEDYADEINSVKPEDLESKFTEIAKRENEKNNWLTRLAVSTAIKLIFESKNEKPETEKTEEEKTKENKQKAEEIANKTDETTIQISSWEKKFDQKEFETRWWNINTQWNNLKDWDFEKNKQAILNIYTTALTTFEAFSSQKKISWNNITFSYPTIVSNMMDKIFEMTKFMKDKKEYVAAANGFRSMLNAGWDSIKPMPTPDISTIWLNDTDRKKLTDQLQKAKTQEEITKIIYGYIHSPNYQEKYNKQVMNWYNWVKNHIWYIEEKHINKTSNSPEFRDRKSVV